PGAVKLLNVLQGRNLQECNRWYKAVRAYPFEGWALAGASAHDFFLLIYRLAQLKKDGELAEKSWVHVLGHGTPVGACLLSDIQRVLRITTNPHLTISFDTSSPFEVPLDL